MPRLLIGCTAQRILGYFLLVAFSTITAKLYFDYLNAQVKKSLPWESASDNKRPITHQGFSGKSTESTTQPAELPQLPSSEFYIRMLSARSPPRGDLFDPQINATELRATVKLLWAFLDLCKQHNIQVMLYGGTLLGSYRHHGVIPWDDDLDMLMREADKRRLIEALKGHPDLRLRQAGRWKVSSKSHCLNVARHGCWPFIDLSFHELEGGWVNDLHDSFGKKCRYPEKVTFPLHKRPFMGRWVDSPRDALNFLSYSYEPSNACISLHYSHKFERYPNVTSVSIDCKELALTYPFVYRVPDSATSRGGVLETLVFSDGGPVYTVPVNEPNGVINAIYSTLLLKN
ncbi:hypothetical protein BOX15_Mlig027643g3 [Macrostomum lignano]|uniref:LicD/FKTN/FKRP nucleotidyltransferase domain-containing protein n=1 Tax=Macrostomum lignano TaxID=282301 RepID=A0A267DKA0_9PLAT|nr:hypothetical protein BOX15_Mlig027643g3 [Macrostomum lignano]